MYVPELGDARARGTLDGIAGARSVELLDGGQIHVLEQPLMDAYLSIKLFLQVPLQ
ncbi:MAG: hypothetical protein HYX60_03900 [Legionella longbeachae]|nr:hypothetical protein [Legionella longbeachae]